MGHSCGLFLSSLSLDPDISHIGPHHYLAFSFSCKKKADHPSHEVILSWKASMLDLREISPQNAIV